MTTVRNRSVPALDRTLDVVVAHVLQEIMVLMDFIDETEITAGPRIPRVRLRPFSGAAARMTGILSEEPKASVHLALFLCRQPRVGLDEPLAASQIHSDYGSRFAERAWS